MPKYLRMLQARGYWEKAGGEEEAGGGGGGGEPGDNPGSAGEGAGVGEGAGEGAGEKNTQSRQFSSDEAAELLKENMKRKKEQKRLAEELSAAQSKLKEFEGVDLEKVRELMAASQAAEEEKLRKSGEWDRLRAQMVEQHKKEKAELEALANANKNRVSELENIIGELTVGNAFGSSKFISDETMLTISKARVIYGSHFEYQDGQVVGFDKPAGQKDRTILVDGSGEPLKFEDAIKKIVQADPDWPAIAKSKMKPGANSGTKGSDRSPEVKAELRGVSRIAAGLSKTKK